MSQTETNQPIDAEPFSEHTVNMLVSPELLRDVLRQLRKRSGSASPIRRGYNRPLR